MGYSFVNHHRYYGSSRCHVRSYGHRSQKEGVLTQYSHNYAPVHPPVQHRTHVAVRWPVGRQASLSALLPTIGSAHHPDTRSLVVACLRHMPRDLSGLFRHSSVQVLLYQLRGNRKPRVQNTRIELHQPEGQLFLGRLHRLLGYVVRFFEAPTADALQS